MIRLARTSLPDYYEQVPLRPAAGAAGWGLAACGILGGLLVAALAGTPAAEAAAFVLVLVGGVALGAMWKCRQYEIAVGTVRIEIGTGPFRDTLATGAVRSFRRVPATSWRKLYAAEEVVLEFDVGPRRAFRAPTRDAEGLLASLPPARVAGLSAVPPP